MNSNEALEKLNETAKRSINELYNHWQDIADLILESLVINKNPDYCLDGVHEYYAKFADPISIDDVVNEITDTIDRNDSKTFTFDIVDNQQLLVVIIQGSSYGESIRILRTGIKEYKGCISSNDGAYHFLKKNN